MSDPVTNPTSMSSQQRSAIEKQIADLRDQIASLSSRLARQTKQEAGALTTAMRENPTATSSLLLIVGSVCFALGWTLGSARHEQQHRRWW